MGENTEYFRNETQSIPLRHTFCHRKMHSHEHRAISAAHIGSRRALVAVWLHARYSDCRIALYKRHCMLLCSYTLLYVPTLQSVYTT
jgi:hypothetical protein